MALFQLAFRRHSGMSGSLAQALHTTVAGLEDFRGHCTRQSMCGGLTSHDQLCLLFRCPPCRLSLTSPLRLAWYSPYLRALTSCRAIALMPSSPSLMTPCPGPTSPLQASWPKVKSNTYLTKRLPRPMALVLPVLTKNNSCYCLGHPAHARPSALL